MKKAAHGGLAALSQALGEGLCNAYSSSTLAPATREARFNSTRRISALSALHCPRADNRCVLRSKLAPQVSGSGTAGTGVSAVNSVLSGTAGAGTYTVRVLTQPLSSDSRHRTTSAIIARNSHRDISRGSL